MKDVFSLPKTLEATRLSEVVLGLKQWERLLASTPHYTTPRPFFEQGTLRLPALIDSAPHRSFIALWAFGHLAKHQDPEALAQKTYKISNPSFHTFPDNIHHLSHLQHVIIHGSKWTHLPDFFGFFPNLRCLNLFDNRLVDLPPSLEQCTRLASLTLASNPMTELPPVLRHLSSVETLNLRRTHLSTLPDWIGELQQLKELHLHDTPLIQLPNTIVALNKLETLNCCNTPLRALPTNISRCSSLRRLDLRNTEVSTVPADLKILRCAHTVIAGGTQPKLSHLHLDQVHEPLDLTRFPSLERLSLHHSSGPMVGLEKCQNLRVLDLRFYRASALPDNLPATLEHLDLRWSNITKLPDAFGNGQRLLKLNLQYTPMQTLPASLQAHLLDHCYDENDNIQWRVEITADPPILRLVDSLRGQCLLQRVEHDPIFQRQEHLVIPSLPTVPKVFCSFTNLRSIVFQGPAPRELLHEIAFPASLQHIDLTALQLRSLSAAFVLPLLQNLTITNGSISPSIEILVPQQYQAKLLHMTIQQLQQQRRLRELTSLSLEGCQTIPTWISTCSNLQHLSLLNSHIQTVPDVVQELVYLTRVDYDCGQLKTTPSWLPEQRFNWRNIGEFNRSVAYSRLLRLHLRQAHLQSLPEPLFQHARLQYLNLSFNRLSGLPLHLCALRDLRCLDLRANPLVMVPKVLSLLPKLSDLWLPTHLLSQCEVLWKEHPTLRINGLSSNILPTSSSTSKDLG